MTASELNVAVIVASLGRPDALSALMVDLRMQTQKPDRIILSVPSTSDLPADLVSFPEVETILAPRGSCVQRNVALDRLGMSSDIVVFIDDDYVPSRFAIERIADFFAANPDIAGATGHLLADGANGPGIDLEDARAMLAVYDGKPAPSPVVFRELHGLYGCNMAFRTKHLGSVRFDERLPLYGWQEDIDFSAQVRSHGPVVKTFAFAGVHRGIKAGRSAGIRVGYSQVVNPVYLVRKGTMRPRYALKIVARNVCANCFRSFRPEPWVDRLGRGCGNWLGLVGVAFGRITPERLQSL